MGGGALSTGGLFAIVRHPAFAASLIWSLCWALLTGSPWAVPVALVATGALGLARAVVDDHSLEQQDELGFRAWAKRTNRFVPTLD